MAEPAPLRQAPLLDVTLTPGPALSRRGLVGLSGALIGVAGALIAAGVEAGAGLIWPVALVAAVLIDLLIRAHQRGRAGEAERITVEPGRVRVARRLGDGREAERTLESWWTRVEHDPADPTGDLTLRAGAAAITVGAFLDGAERAHLAAALTRALARARTAA